MKNYNDSLHVVFQYNKAGKIGITDVHSFQIFLNEINIEASKSHLNYTTILDTNSLFFSKKLLPYLHSYEWALRKLIYLLAPTYFDNWTKDSIPDEMISAVKGKQKQAIGKYDLDNLLQWIDLYDFEEYLFGENYLFISTGNEKNIVRYKEISVEELLNLFRETDDLSLSDPFSLWSEVFSKYMYVDLEEIRKDMELIREGRNIVSHNKEVQLSLYQKLIKKLKKYVKQLEEAFQKILTGAINDEEISDMSDDLLGYVDTHFGKASTIRLSEVSKISIGGLARPFSASQSSIVQQIGKIAVPTTGITGLGKVVSASQSSVAQQIGKIAVPTTGITGLGKVVSASQSSVAQQIGKIAVPTTGITGLGKVVSASQSSIAQQIGKIAVPKSEIAGLRKAFPASQSSIAQQIGKIAVPKSEIAGLRKAFPASQSNIVQQIVEQNSGVNTQHGVKEQLNNEEDKYTK